MKAEPRKRSQALTLLLYLLLITYGLGSIFLYITWLGLQSIDTLAWQRDTLPVYALVGVLGIISVFGVLYWRKLGVYGLALTWVITGVLNVVFVRPIPYSSIFFGVLLVIAFFLLLLPAWKYTR